MVRITEAGVPVALTHSAQLQSPIDDLAFSADLAERYEWSSGLGVASPMGIKTNRTIVREPFGVVGAVTPWNFPHQINFAKLGPALAAGNTEPSGEPRWRLGGQENCRVNCENGRMRQAGKKINLQRLCRISIIPYSPYPAALA